jgi:hypothetical protein
VAETESEAESVTVTATEAESDSVAEPEPVAVAEPEPEPEPEPVLRPSQPPADDPASTAAMAEMRDIAQAERLLPSQPERVLEITRQMRARYPEGYFHEERAYLEVMALAALGRTAEMRMRAAGFLKRHPTGPYTARVRKALSSAGH